MATKSAPNQNSHGSFWTKPESYKPCRKKFYDCYVCKPPVGTVVIDEEHHPEFAGKQVFANHKNWLSADEMKAMQNTTAYQAVAGVAKSGVARMINDNDFVICGVNGRLGVVTANQLCSEYTFVQDGQPVRIDSQSFAKRSNKDGTMDWQLIRVSAQMLQQKYAACFVPSNIKTQLTLSSGPVKLNGVKSNQSRGDFIVCPASGNGQPMLNQAFVVTGDIFALTYNNQGWTDCIVPNMTSLTIESCPKLFDKSKTLSSVSPELESGIVKLRETIKQGIQSGYKSYNPNAQAVYRDDWGSPKVSEKIVANLGFSPDYIPVLTIENGKEKVAVVANTKTSKFTVVAVGAGKFTAGNFSAAVLFTNMFAGLQKQNYAELVAAFADTEASVGDNLSVFLLPHLEEINAHLKAGTINKLDFEKWRAADVVYSYINMNLSGVSSGRLTYYSVLPNHASAKNGDTIKLREFTYWTLSFNDAVQEAKRTNSVVFTFSTDENIGWPISHIIKDGGYNYLVNVGLFLAVEAVFTLSDKVHLACCQIHSDSTFDKYKVFHNEDNFSNKIADRVVEFENDPKIGVVLYDAQVERGKRYDRKITFQNRFVDSHDVLQGLVIVEITERKENDGTFEVTTVFGDPGDVHNHIKTKKTIFKSMNDSEALESVKKEVLRYVNLFSMSDRGPIGDFAQKFMVTIARKFTTEGFQLLSQKFEPKTDKQTDVRGSITINGDNDDHITLRFSVTPDMKLRVIARSQSTKLQHEFDAKDQSLYNNIYTTVTKRFNLNQWKRIEQAFNMVARYKNVTVRRREVEHDTGYYNEVLFDIGVDVVKVRCDGGRVDFFSSKPEISSRLTVEYFDSIRKIASGIANAFFNDNSTQN